MIHERERDVVLVYGKTGMGKSRWTRRYLQGCRRVICVDPMREHAGQLFEDIGELIGHVREYPTFRVRTEWPPDTNVLAAVSMAANDPRKWCEHHDTPGHRCTIPELTYVVEESGRSIPARGELHPAIEDLVYRGRHHRVTPVLISQRPSTVHIIARSQWTRLIAFHQTEGADVGWLSEQTGEPDEAFSALQPGEYFDATPTGIRRLILPDQWDTIGSVKGRARAELTDSERADIHRASSEGERE